MPSDMKKVSFALTYLSGSALELIKSGDAYLICTWLESWDKLTYFLNLELTILKKQRKANSRHSASQSLTKLLTVRATALCNNS